MAAKPLKKSAAAQKTVAAGSLLNMAKPGDRQGVALDALAADLMSQWKSSSAVSRFPIL